MTDSGYRIVSVRIVVSNINVRKKEREREREREGKREIEKDKMRVEHFLKLK